MDRIRMMAERIELGLARRWIRRNWWPQPPKAAADFRPHTPREEFQVRRARPKIQTEEGYARRWIKRNWWRCIACAGWVTAGIWIRAAVAAGRPESWPVGGEIIPAAACWVMAALLAMGEVSPRKRRTRKQGDRRDI